MKKLGTKKSSYLKKLFWIGLIGFVFWIFLQNITQNNFDFEAKLYDLLNNKKNMSNEEFYDELTKLHDKLDRKLRQEYGTVQSLDYVIDFRCLNECLTFTNRKKKDCSKICMVPKEILSNPKLGF